VVDELNCRLAPTQGCRLSVWRWETDARPGLHLEGPQGLIDERMQMDDADVVVGIFWKRFGTPTGDADSGTEHELRRAWEAWREQGRPDVMVYFCKRPATPQSNRASRYLIRQANPDPSTMWIPAQMSAGFPRDVSGSSHSFVSARIGVAGSR
jgi:hypothetical protein